MSAADDRLQPGPPALAQVRRFYDSDAVIERFNRSFAGQWHTPFVLGLPGVESAEDLLCGLLRVGPGCRLLDFGSGVGVTTCRIAQRTGCQARGLNISAKQVGIAAELAQRLGLEKQVAFDLYPGRELPYPDHTFDAVIFFESVCHVPHKELLFRELLRVLRPGGACAGQDWMLSDDRISAEELETYIRPIEVAVEVELRSLEGYRELMATAGFRGLRTFDARDLAPELGRSFPHRPAAPVRASRRDPDDVRLTSGDLALSAAFHRGLFTIGLVFGEKPPRSSRPIDSPVIRRGIASAPPGGRRAVPRCRVVPVEEQRLEIFSRRKNLSCVDYHRSRFAVPDSEPLRTFARLVERSAACTLESSCKVTPEGTHSARWNLFCHGEHKELFLSSVLAFFSEVAGTSGLTLDHGPVNRFLDAGIDFSRVRKVVTGVDLGGDRASSRLKLWFMLGAAPGLVERAISLRREREPVASLRFHDDFLVGFDLGFDGRSAVKLYPDVTREELADSSIRRRLAELLPKSALSAMEQCSWTHLYIADHNPDTILQLHPSDPDDFVARYVPGEAIRDIHRAYAGARLLDMVVAIPAHDLDSLPAGRFTLYYMPADPPSAWTVPPGADAD